MPFNVTITIVGDKEVKAKLKKLGPSLYDFKHGMGVIGKELRNYYSSAPFASRGGVYDDEWKDLSPVYKAWKVKKYGTAKVLYSTGRMQGAFTYTASNQAVVVENKTKYFAYHQSSAPRDKIPRRKMIGVNSQVKSIIKQAIQADIKKKLG